MILTRKKLRLRENTPIIIKTANDPLKLSLTKWAYLKIKIKHKQSIYNIIYICRL